MAMTSALRIVCVGTNLETEIALQALLKNDVPVVGLVTWPSAEPGGGSDYRDLHPLLEERGVAAVDTTDINSPDTLNAIHALNPDYIFTLGWSQLFRKDLLMIPRGFVVGSHPSPLPHGRGRAPIPWTVLQEQRRSAVTLFRMDLGVDSGPILIQRSFDIPPRPVAKDVYDLVAANLGSAFSELYVVLRDGTVEERPQGSDGSVRAKRTPADGHLDFQRPADEVDRLIRAVSEPYPGAYSYFEGRQITIWRSALEGVPDYLGVAGQILARKDGRLLVQAADRPLWLSRFTTMGEPISPESFPLGKCFGFRVEDEIHALRQAVEELRKAK